MKIVYKGPQSLVEVHGIGVFQRGEAVDIKDDKVARMLAEQDAFEIVKDIKIKEEKD